MISAHLVRSDKTKVLFVDDGEIFRKLTMLEVYKELVSEVRIECFYEGYRNMNQIAP
jgi:hypothetical protein